VYSSSQGCHTATGTHMPYGITQCHLPPGRGDIPALSSRWYARNDGIDWEFVAYRFKIRKNSWILPFCYKFAKIHKNSLLYISISKFQVCIFCLNFGTDILWYTCTSSPMLALLTLQCCFFQELLLRLNQRFYPICIFFAIVNLIFRIH